MPLKAQFGKVFSKKTNNELGAFHYATEVFEKEVEENRMLSGLIKITTLCFTLFHFKTYFYADSSKARNVNFLLFISYPETCFFFFFFAQDMTRGFFAISPPLHPPMCGKLFEEGSWAVASLWSDSGLVTT